MIDVLGITLLRPLWLAAVPVIVAVAVLAARRARLSDWTRIIDPNLAAHLRALGHIRAGGRDGRIPVFAAAATLGAIALAGPATRSETAPALRNLDTLVVAVDLSRSLTEGGAMEAVRAATARIIEGAAGRPAALVLFAADAYLASVPTEDPRLLATLVAVLDRNTMPDEGSRPDRALALAAEVLGASAPDVLAADASALDVLTADVSAPDGFAADVSAPDVLAADVSGRRRRDVVLISDGGGIGPDALHRTDLLRTAGIRLSAVFVPPTERPYGMPAPQRDALAELAAAGGGTMVEVSRTQRLADTLAPSADGAMPRDIAALTFDDHGRAVLVLALAPALLLFRRRRR